MRPYDFLIVGAGLFGAVFAAEAVKRGKKCLVIDRRPHIGGNCYTEDDGGITVHRYGAHIFHTSDREVWEYVNAYGEFMPYVHCPLANYRGRLYHLPFNMDTFHALWGVVTPEEAKGKVAAQRIPCEQPQNAKERALSLVGRDIYETLIEGYTEKQWGRSADKLPASLIERLPLRFTYDNNYFNDRYQGIPAGGYTPMIERMLKGAEVRLGCDFSADRCALEKLAERVLFTGAIDEYFGYCNGPLEYRSLSFDTKRLPVEDFQGTAVVNYTDRSVPYTRIIEHKHFDGNCSAPGTVITYEYPEAWSLGRERFYPVGDIPNRARYQGYLRLAEEQKDVIFGGRLGLYRYLDMDDVVKEALAFARRYLD